MKLAIYKFSALVAKRYRVILVLLIVALSLSCVYAYDVLAPHYETRTESESVTLCKYKALYEHSTMVEQGNPLWPVGWTLSNQPVYFSNICPTLNGNFNFMITGSSTDISAHYSTKLVISSSVKNVTYWRKERTLSNGDIYLSGTDKLQTAFSLDIAEIAAEIDAIQDSLGFYVGDTNAEVITTVWYNGEVGGEKVDMEKDFALPIEISGSTYKVSSENYDETIKRDVIREVNVLLSPSNTDKIISFSSPSVLFLLIVAFTLIKVKYKPLDESGIQELIKEEEHAKFKDVISRGKLPTDINVGMLRMEVKSLEDLANIAIEKEERVIFDEEASLYFVMHDNLLYLYRRSALQRLEENDDAPSLPGHYN